MQADQILSELLPCADEGVSRVHAGWRKSGSPGQYLGVKKAIRRRIAKKYAGMSFSGIGELLASEVMDVRSVGVLVLLENFRKEDAPGKERIFREFLDYRHLIDDWELVDDLSPELIGSVAMGKMTSGISLLANSGRMWDRRMAMVSTLWPVRRGDLELAYELSTMLCGDGEPLVQKAVGWVLREAGKKDPERLRKFLRDHGRSLSRVTFSYAVERFSGEERRLLGRVSGAPSRSRGLPVALHRNE
ncbi:MAG: DNA alkylation repair protein [Leptospirillum sp.]